MLGIVSRLSWPTQHQYGHAPSFTKTIHSTRVIWAAMYLPSQGFLICEYFKLPIHCYRAPLNADNAWVFNSSGRHPLASIWQRWAVPPLFALPWSSCSWHHPTLSNSLWKSESQWFSNVPPVSSTKLPSSTLPPPHTQSWVHLTHLQPRHGSVVVLRYGDIVNLNNTKQQRMILTSNQTLTGVPFNSPSNSL